MKFKAIFFDLDDTLYGTFGRTFAMNKVCGIISEKHKIKVEDLKKEYNKILKKAQEQAFLDGRAGKEYRTERFQKLLEKFKITDKELIQELLSVYSEILEKNTKIRMGVPEFLDRLQKKHALYLVSEGPPDSQRKVIELLNISPYFKDIFISGELKKRKSNGDLFKYALKRSKYKPDEVLAVGDSYEDDVKGAKAARIKVVLLNTKKKKVPPKGPKPDAQIKELRQLYQYLEKGF